MVIVCLIWLMPLAATAEKRLTIGTPLLPPTLGNPHQNVSLPGTMPLQAVFDTPTRIGADGAPGPALATGWEAVDERTWRLTLRRGVTFSNDDPFNAEAVVAAFDYLLSEAGKSEAKGTHFTRMSPAHVLPAAMRLKSPPPVPMPSCPYI